jgi:hypothetical protein
VSVTVALNSSSKKSLLSLPVEAFLSFSYKTSRAVEYKVTEKNSKCLLADHYEQYWMVPLLEPMSLAYERNFPSDFLIGW